MWIHSIRLQNFKSYDHAFFSFPEPKDGRNIVLIGAQNGHGKTTLLEAVYLCLYDKDAISHLARAGLNTNETHYPDFLKAALHHRAEPRYGLYTMSLEIEMRQYWRGEIRGLKIKRSWHFDNNKKLQADDNEVSVEIYHDGSYHPVDEDQAGHYLNAYALPFDYAPFFFFDGEKIVQAAQHSGAGNWLNIALKGLLGVTLLDRLRNSLSEYRKKYISENTSQKMQEELHRTERALQAAEAQRDVFQEEYAKLDAQLAEWSAKYDNLLQQLGGGSDIRTSDDFLQQKIKLDKEIEEFNEKVKAAVKAMPLAFLPRGRLKLLQIQLNQEKNRLNHEAGKNQIAEKVDDFWGAFVSSDKVKEVLGRSASVILDDPMMKEAVKDCWENLFYPLPENCAQAIEHNYLSVNAHAEIQNEINRLGNMPQDKIGGLLEEADRREQERKQVLEEINKLKGTNKDELVEQLKQAKNETGRLSGNKGHLKNQLMQQEKNYQKYKAEVARLQDNISDNNPHLLKSRRAGEVDKVIVRLTEELMKQKVGEVGEAATRINRAIAHDERIDRIRIDAGGKMALFGRDGCETRVDLSAGQMQILIMSLVSALAEVTRYNAPFVIDTPLARLDEGHRQGLFRHWSGLQQQVILLSQDTEITPQVRRQLEPHISRTYLVEADSLDSAGARSRVTADFYFE
ncbi:DNA sulfur modification protein DndD [Neisseria weaveri]|uniref:DNA sulfur modification protein DndD n=1 Tax=Neisseria weaveri TaxID=28091 RepID=UPI000D316F11|nr:DNA sulfur modification protein DndD [Neisseria weaveri]